MTDALRMSGEITLSVGSRRLERWDKLAKELNVKAENEAYPLLDLLEALVKRTVPGKVEVFLDGKAIYAKLLQEG